jgi:hypothetical protein
VTAGVLVTLPVGMPLMLLWIAATGDASAVTVCCDASSLTGSFSGFVFATSDPIRSALSSESAYLNVHTTAYLAGEIRGQIGARECEALLCTSCADWLRQSRWAWVWLSLCGSVQAPPAVYYTTVYLTGCQYPVNGPVVSTTAFGVATVTLHEATHCMRDAASCGE